MEHGSGKGVTLMVVLRIRGKSPHIEVQEAMFNHWWRTVQIFESLAECVKWLRAEKEREIQKLVDDWAENA